jgi:hypothetical protein
MSGTILENPIKNKFKKAEEEIPVEPMTSAEALRDVPTEVQKSPYSTQIVNLPSKGLLYPPDNPLSAGVVEIKYMTTKEEDILSTTSYIKNDVVIDKLLQSLLVTRINYDDLLLGDKNAIMIAARTYGYGKDYPIKVTTPSGNEQDVVVDLELLENKEFDESGINRGENRFEFILPIDRNVVEFQLITVGLNRKIDAQLKKNRIAVSKGARDTQLTTRLGYMITSVDGNNDPHFIRLFVESIKAMDSRALRNYISSVQPDIDLSVDVIDEETGDPFRADVRLDTSFFWPNG